MSLVRTADGFSSADVEGMGLDPQSQDPAGYQTPRDLGIQPKTDGQDPATPGGPAPYNGAEPTGKPVTTDPMWQSPDEPPKPPYSPTPYLGPGPNVDVTTLHNARRRPVEETMTVDLWVEASHDVAQELDHERLVRAKVATSAIWPFLSAARTEREFGHRVALCAEELEQLFPEDDFRSRVTASLRQDFLLVKEADYEVVDYGTREITADPIVATAQGVDWIRHEALSESDVPEGSQTGTAGNPAYFSAGPEAGPNTGSDGQFAQMAPDPYNPMNAQYPMQPSQWVVPPDAGWVERPMNFGKTSAAEPVVEWDHHDGHAYGFMPGTDNEIAHVRPRPRSEGGGAYAHYRWRGEDTPDEQVKHFPVPSVEMGKSEIERLHSNRRQGAAGYVGEGVQTGPGQNPSYFADTEGVAGTAAQGGFPADVTLPEPDERVDAYGGVPPVQSGGSTGGDVAYSNSGKQASRWVVADKDNHGACAHCNTPVYREGDTWKHLGGNPGHGVRLHEDHPWVAAQQANRVMAVRHTAPGGGEHAPYDIRPVEGGYAVFNDKGERKNDEPKSKEDARDFQKALYANVPGASESAKAASLRWVVAEASSSDTGSAQPAQTDVGGAPTPPASMEPGGPGAEAGQPLTIPNQGASTNPFATGGGGPETAGPAPGVNNPFMATKTAEQRGRRPDMFNPSEGPADEYTNNTWNGPAEQRPLQGSGDRHINTPQTAGEPIPIRSSEGGEDDEEERE
jgi:hypothetical protein